LDDQGGEQQMIKVRKGNLFESGAQTLVNTVNCVGVMGKGVALGFRRKFPDMYADYLERCEAGQVRLGEPYLFRRLLPPWILNFPTKDHWRSVAKLSDIVTGLEYLARHYKEWGIESLAVPPLGCGEGRLDWRIVGPTLYRQLETLDLDVELYAPFDVPDEQVTVEFLRTGAGEVVSANPFTPRILPAAVALVAIVDCVEKERYHWPIGRTTFQKMAYFATEAGIPTGLEYRRGSYGPFAEGLKSMQTQLVNNGLLSEERQESWFMIRTGPTYADAANQYRGELEAWWSIIERVADLFLRVSTRQAEVLASVHYVARQLCDLSKSRGIAKPTEAEIMRDVMKWKIHRTPPLSEEEVASAICDLNMFGWVDVTPTMELSIEPELEVRI
jgi:O-acetyl-ADP-ribose deacetylase (regulator of RNase III)/uncharacterized protein YwgA